MPDWAIVVGINQYPEKTGQTELQGAVADACDFASWSLDPAGGNVPFANLRFWTFPPPGQQEGLLGEFLDHQTQWEMEDIGLGLPREDRGPKAIEIIETGQTIGRAARNEAVHGPPTDERRRIYVFLAGHGVRARQINNPNPQTCFMAYDFRPTSGNMVLGLVPCESFRDALLVERFTEAILFLDCCRLSSQKLQEKAVTLTDQADVTIGLTWGLGNAAQDGKAAFETTSQPVRGAFSKTLMQGLRGHRVGNAQELHMETLKQYVQSNISANTDQDQVPSLIYGPDALSGPLLVSGPPTIAPEAAPPGPLVHLDALPPGTEVVVKSDLTTLVPDIPILIAGVDPVRLNGLRPGLYLIEVRNTPARFAMLNYPMMQEVHVP